MKAVVTVSIDEHGNIEVNAGVPGQGALPPEAALEILRRGETTLLIAVVKAELVRESRIIQIPRNN